MILNPYPDAAMIRVDSTPVLAPPHARVRRRPDREKE
jgi:hypothetical protein